MGWKIKYHNKNTRTDLAAQDLMLQVVEGWGQFWVPWYQSHWWDALGPCLGLGGDAQPWLLSYFCHHSSKIIQWNEGAVCGVSKRTSIPVGGSFSPNIFRNIRASDWNCSALPALGWQLHSKTHVIAVLAPQQIILVYLKDFEWPHTIFFNY